MKQKNEDRRVRTTIAVVVVVLVLGLIGGVVVTAGGTGAFSSWR